MNQDFIDDSGKPFEPETPEAFFQRGEEAFQIWWSELDPPGASGGLELDYETARAVWSAAYEHSADCIMLVYDGAEANAGGAHPTGEMELACVVHRHHNVRQKGPPIIIAGEQANFRRKPRGCGTIPATSAARGVRRPPSSSPPVRRRA